MIKGFIEWIKGGERMTVDQASGEALNVFNHLPPGLLIEGARSDILAALRGGAHVNVHLAHAAIKCLAAMEIQGAKVEHEIKRALALTGL